MTPVELLKLLGILASFLTGTGALITALANRRSARATDRVAEAEADKTEINGQSVVITNLRDEVARLCVRVEQLEADQNELQRKYDHVLSWAMPRGYKPPASW